jgi:uncharacterized protein (DUF488 family)
MYYRRKVLLALLETFDNELEPTRLQKLLFLLSRKQRFPSYDFVPYQYGAFSFQAYSDLGTLSKYQQVVQEEGLFRKLDTCSYVDQLHKSDQLQIARLKDDFGNLSRQELVHYTYSTYPWFAINSTIIEQVNLSLKQKNDIFLARERSQKTALFTIGYQGKSLEKYLGQLLEADINILVDVRRNSISMKYGFSKGTLSKACKGVGIEYIHLPQLGIDSSQRQDLTNQADYDSLFIHYAAGLKEQQEAVEVVTGLVEEKKRVAITCFEAEVCQCHRGILAREIESMPEWKHPIIHLS